MSSTEFPGPSFRICDAASRLAHAHREGFRVQPPGGFVGLVEALRSAPSRRWDRPTELAMHAGRSSETLSIHPAETENVFVAEASRPPTSEDGTDRADDAAGRT